MGLTVDMLSPRLFRCHFDNTICRAVLCAVPGQFNVKILVIVNASPWGGSLAVTALRMVRAMVSHGYQIAAVYFREEAVYQALAGRVTDHGTPALRDAWLELLRLTGAPLLLCSAAAQRRLERPPEAGFREAGLAEILDLMNTCDRVVTF
jgi:sulfur relay (sulfurtransferase) complex TusBCD TusD component (DsrE family)